MPARLYTDNEVRMIYRQAKDQKKQIRILADLNCCSVGDIRAIVQDLREGEPIMNKKYDWSAIFAAIDQGADNEEIAEKYGVTAKAIKQEMGRRRAAAKKKADALVAAKVPPASAPTTAEPAQPENAGGDEAKRIQALLRLVRGDDGEEIKSITINLIRALSEQALARTQ